MEMLKDIYCPDCGRNLYQGRIRGLYCSGCDRWHETGASFGDVVTLRADYDPKAREIVYNGGAREMWTLVPKRVD